MIRIGCLGAARITPRSLIAPAKSVPGVVVQAVAARDPERAKVFAAEHAIAHVAATYEDLIARDDVDLIYNALPPFAHAQWSIAALKAGKHVLCEKPFCLNAREALSMAQAARDTGKTLIEGYHYRHHDLMKRLADILASGVIGRVCAMSGAFKVPVRRTPEELRWRAELGGGAMMDLGCYPLDAMRVLVRSEPEVVSAHAKIEQGVDREMNVQLRFGAVEAKITAAMRPGFPYALLHIRGEHGSLRARNFVAPQIGNLITYGHGPQRRVEIAGGPSTFEAQLAHVAAVIAGDAPQNPTLEDSIAQMNALGSVYAAAGLPRH